MKGQSAKGVRKVRKGCERGIRTLFSFKIRMAQLRVRKVRIRIGFLCAREKISKNSPLKQKKISNPDSHLSHSASARRCERGCERVRKRIAGIRGLQGVF